MKLFETTYESAQFPSKPTLKQYLKGIGTGKRPKKHLVQIIWFPGKFDSYGLETEHFRTSIVTDSELGKALAEMVKEPETVQNSVYLEVVITPKQANKLLFSLGKESGQWIEFPTANPRGIKFES